MVQKLHLKAPENWINDPNGFIYYKGEYHLFYQHFPYEPRWGTMHWGHAVSRDLVNWEHKGIALYPTKYEDQNGCFSGSAVEHEGRMYLYYTGVHYNQVNPENIHRCLNEQFESSQMMLVSEDGIHFDNLNGKKVVIPPISDRKIGDRTHTRDPKVWRGKDAWYMVLGSSTEDQRGELLFYRSKNLEDWELVNQVSRESGFGWMWECPDYFETEGGQVLVFSPMGFLKDGQNKEDQTLCTLVEFEEETCKMEMSDIYQYLDYGLDLYAPQSTLDEKGRRVLIAWLRMPEAVEGKWSGMFCLPRVVEVRDEHIYFQVHPNVEKMYTREIASPAEADEAGYRIRLELKDGESIRIGGYQIYREGNRIGTDRSAVFPAVKGFGTKFTTPELKDGCHLDIYVSPNIIEVYVNRGEYVVSNTVYGLGNEISAEVSGAVALHTLPVSEEGKNRV